MVDVSELMPVMRCATHPHVETQLQCASCGTPICPDCLVDTPVGMKCRRCGLAPLPPRYRLSHSMLVLGVGAGTTVAAVMGFLVLAFPFIRALGFLLLFLAPVAGHVVGSVAGWAASGKRGPVIAGAAAGSCVAGMLVVAPELIGLMAGDSLLGPLDLLYLAGVRPLVAVFAGLAAIFAYRSLR